MSDGVADKQLGTNCRLGDFLAYQLSISSNAVSGLIAKQYQVRFGLKVAEWRIMAVLGDVGSATQRELTDATIMDKVAINRACKVLEDRGLIERNPNAEDGRSHLLTLTVEGLAIHAEVLPLAKRNEDQILAVLDDTEREQLRSILRRIYEHAKAIDGKRDNKSLS